MRGAVVAATILMSIAGPTAALHHAVGTSFGDPPPLGESPAAPDAPDQPVYHAGEPWESVAPADQSGSTYGVGIGLFDIVPVTYAGSSAAHLTGTEKTWANDPFGAPSGTIAHPWFAGADLWGPSTGFQASFYAYLFGDGSATDDEGNPLVAGNPPFQDVDPGDCETLRCQLLTPADVSALGGGLPAVCVYVPGGDVVRGEAGLCRDIELRFHDGVSRSDTWIEGRRPGWWGTAWVVPASRERLDVYGVVNPVPGPAACVEPGFSGGTAFDHDVLRLTGIGLVDALAAEATAPSSAQIAGLAGTTSSLGERPFPEGVVERPAAQPDHPDDTSGAFTTAGTSTIVCGVEGPFLSADEPWSNHVRAHVAVYAGIGWWPPRSPGQLLNVTPDDYQPWSGPVHYLANSYSSDLGQVRDPDDDGEVEECTMSLGASAACVPMLWDRASCVEPTGFCASALAQSFGFRKNTGLLMSLRTLGPIVVWDLDGSRLNPVFSFPAVQEVCIVGWNGGPDGIDPQALPDGIKLVDRLCQGVPAERRFATDNAFLPQEGLGEYRSRLRWSPLGPERDVFGFESGRLELHYLIDADQNRLTGGFPDQLDLGSRAHCGRLGVLACYRDASSGLDHVVYDWVDVQAIRV